MQSRRGTYFTFQGLLMAVLLLLFYYHSYGAENWAPRFLFLMGALTGSLAFLRLASEGALALWWVQMGLFVADAALASLTLHWTRPDSDLYLIYFLIIFGAALTRSLSRSLAIAALTSALYLLSSWSSAGLPLSPEFWLRFQFLWVVASVLAILSQDTSQAQSEQERDYQARLVQVESLATLGQVAGEVAHRIKGPLTTILVNAEVLSHRYARSSAALHELSQIQEEVQHCKEILKHLLDLGRIEEMDLVPFDLREPVRSALKSIQPQAHKSGLRLEVEDVDAPLAARGDPSLIHEAVLALLQNALEASRKGGRIWVNFKVDKGRFWWLRSGKNRERHLLSIRDEGSGIAPENLKNIFKPFFTTKGKEGHGLGLSASLRILQKHGGSIEARSDGPGLGACFTLSLPALPRARRFRKSRGGRQHPTS